MLEEVLSRITGKPVKEPLNERCLTYAREHGVPHPLIKKLEACAYAGPIRIGPLTLSRLAELDQDNAYEENSNCLRHGFLMLGSGVNGDFIALELASGRMAFVAHDDLWERTYKDFEECVVRTPLTFDEFWVQAHQAADFPRDCRDAEERWGLQPMPK
jgi:hypothetical protein